jgi:hypothetical protein
MLFSRRDEDVLAPFTASPPYELYH